MYAKNLPAHPKLDYPYQEQQRYSGSFVTNEGAKRPADLSPAVIQQIKESMERAAESK